MNVVFHSVLLYNMTVSEGEATYNRYTSNKGEYEAFIIALEYSTAPIHVAR